MRVTFFWGTMGFALLTLDVIPGLTELVSLVRVPPQLPLSQHLQQPVMACSVLLHRACVSLLAVQAQKSCTVRAAMGF